MLQRQDILDVAKSIKKLLSDSQADAVLNEYNKLEDSDEHWVIIVEDIIYRLYA